MGTLFVGVTDELKQAIRETQDSGKRIALSRVRHHREDPSGNLFSKEGHYYITGVEYARQFHPRLGELLDRTDEEGQVFVFSYDSDGVRFGIYGLDDGAAISGPDFVSHEEIGPPR